MKCPIDTEIDLVMTERSGVEIDYCPTCLGENGGAWLRSWKQPWHFACSTHQSALLPLCLGCHRRANYGRTDGGWKPLFPAYVPVPGCCHNSRTQPGKRRVKGPCLHDHRLDTPGDPLNDELHEVQKLLLNERQPFHWWNDMRALSTYTLTVLEIDNVEDVLGFSLPEATGEAWIEQRQERLQRLQDGRERYRSEGLSPKTISQDTTGRTPPTDPLVMAPAAAVAYRAITNTEMLGRLASFSRSDAVHVTPASRLSNLRASEDLQERVKVAYIRNPALYKTGLHSHYQSRIEQPVNWDPENLPPFLWHDLYDAHLGQILTKVTRTVGRRFASMALYRAATGSTWTAAHAKFDDGNFAQKTFSRLLDANRTQNGGPGKEAIAEAIAATSLALNTDSRIDSYPRLRAAVNTLLTESIPADIYAAALNVPRRTQPTDLQLRYAAIWLWADLTNDEPRNAPNWHREGTKFLQGSYRQWLLRLEPDELQRLREWGQAQLGSLLVAGTTS